MDGNGKHFPRLPCQLVDSCRQSRDSHSMLVAAESAVAPPPADRRSYSGRGLPKRTWATRIFSRKPVSGRRIMPVRATRDTFEKIGTYEIPDISLCPSRPPGAFESSGSTLAPQLCASLTTVHAPNVFSPSMRKAPCWPRDLACPCLELPVPPAPPFFPFAPPITPSSADVPHTSPALPHRESAWQGQVGR
jgi:hypothetical protein